MDTPNTDAKIADITAALQDMYQASNGVLHVRMLNSAGAAYQLLRGPADRDLQLDLSLVEQFLTAIATAELLCLFCDTPFSHDFGPDTIVILRPSLDVIALHGNTLQSLTNGICLGCAQRPQPALYDAVLGYFREHMLPGLRVLPPMPHGIGHS